MAEDSRAELSRRLGTALGAHTVPPADRATIQAAFAQANSWSDLPPDVRRLVEGIERSAVRL